MIQLSKLALIRNADPFVAKTIIQVVSPVLLEVFVILHACTGCAK